MIAEVGQGRQRAEALGLLGTILYESDDFGHSIAILEQAFAEAGEDVRLRCHIAAEWAFALAHSGDVAGATSRIEAAVEECARIGEDGLLAELLAGWVILRVMQGEEIDTACLERALTLEDVDRPSHALMWPSFNAAVLHTWRHDVDRARPAFADVFQRCVDRALRATCGSCWDSRRRPCGRAMSLPLKSSPPSWRTAAGDDRQHPAPGVGRWRPRDRRRLARRRRHGP